MKWSKYNTNIDYEAGGFGRPTIGKNTARYLSIV